MLIFCINSYKKYFASIFGRNKFTSFNASHNSNMFMVHYQGDHNSGKLREFHEKMENSGNFIKDAFLKFYKCISKYFFSHLK